MQGSEPDKRKFVRTVSSGIYEMNVLAPGSFLVKMGMNEEREPLAGSYYVAIDEMKSMNRLDR